MLQVLERYIKSSHPHPVRPPLSLRKVQYIPPPRGFEEFFAKVGADHMAVENEEDFWLQVCGRTSLRKVPVVWCSMPDWVNLVDSVTPTATETGLSLYLRSMLAQKAFSYEAVCLTTLMSLRGSWYTAHYVSISWNLPRSVESKTTWDVDIDIVTDTTRLANHWRKTALRSVDMNSTKKCSEFRQLPQVLISITFIRQRIERIWRNMKELFLKDTCRTVPDWFAECGLWLCRCFLRQSVLVTLDSWLVTHVSNWSESCFVMFIYYNIYIHIYIYIYIYIYIFTYIL